MFLFLYLLVATGCEGELTGTATCETAGPGGPARVLCQFSENVVEVVDVSAVLLRRFPFHDNGGKEAEEVVECHRYLGNQFDCLPKDGYRITGPVSDQLVINITRAQAEHQGLYSCEIGMQQTTNIMAFCILKCTVSDTGPKDHEGWNALLIVSIVCFVVGFLTLMVSCIVNIIRKGRKLRRQNEGANAIKQEQDVHKMQEMPLNVPTATDQTS